jgi:hypothetical protein
MRKTMTALLIAAALSGNSIRAAAADDDQAPNSGVMARAMARAVAEQARNQAPLTLPPSLRKQRAPTLRPILIGAGVGAAFFSLASIAFCDGGSCGSDTAKAALRGAGCGAVAGFVISMR